jgi:NAD(P)-dependent dehydrogenase (short-subunit alcohol dehydrogenase family)
MSTVLVTGGSTGIGRLTAEALARHGHRVYAGMRDIDGRNASAAATIAKLSQEENVAITAVELDVCAQDSADAAVASVLADAERLDVVVHNAGHMSLGYTEAFTAEDFARQYDVNTIGAHRVNRAALPHLRAQGHGVLVYVGSTTSVSLPPFMTPYVAAKTALDALAQTTSYEVSQFGVETVIVMPGAFTRGTAHFSNASAASDSARSAAYASLDRHVERYGQATQNLFAPGDDPDPETVAVEITRVLELPHGGKPLRTVVDFTRSQVDHVNQAAQTESFDFLTRMGFGDLLDVATPRELPQS